MLKNELSCLLILLCVSPEVYWSLWTRPKPLTSAILSIPCREQPLPQVRMRHGNMTTVRDVALSEYFPSSLSFECFAMQ